MVDAADTLALSHADLDVALVSPGGVPRVPHDVISLLTFVAITDSLDGVIKIGWAIVSLSYDSARVVAEDVVAGGDGDTDGALFEASLDTVGVFSDLSVIRN